MGARLLHYAPAWSWCQDKTVLRWIREGYQIPFHTPPPLTRTVRPFCLPAENTRRLLLLHEIQVLLDKNVLARVPVSQLGHASFYASMFLVPKPNGTYRPILNVSQAECVHRLSTFQDGDRSVSTCERAPCRLVILDQSQGCIPACSDSPRFLQIPAVGSFANRSLSLPG